ncbi:phosphate-binding pstS 3 domain protein [Mycobacterium xenopi 4042]|uniref:Phosphate-binding pstS 3 domain protein n=1 Tax=Mycobacterium xenopi 4042 TaxID=1299334 RepID=X7ZYB9_MYCXE|nr:phosphate-binding pstS 3 domain protein [Mycobacterium xenopi 4042]
MKLDMVRRALDIVVSATAIAALTLTGCGTDNNAPSGKGSSGKPAVDCGGKNELTAEGSTAQQNAIALFNRAWASHAQAKAWPTTRPARAPAGNSSSPVMSTSPDRTRRWPPARSRQRPSAATEIRRGTCRWCSGRSR